MKFMGLGFELLASIILGAYLGSLLDNYWALSKPYMTILGMFLFLSASFYHLIKAISYMDK
jgi:F0F1-type ATP synthase assembly protein I